ncbi:MAG: metallophosphoesterase [Desulfatibacillaceae bacterium]|nr:metallophosphoesterase [Desulfatibacillaceae bacterium]
MSITLSDSTKKNELTGVVISDLHMFARRSKAEYILEKLHHACQSADLLVLNGDIFDFRWTTLDTVHDTMMAAISWLEHLTEQFEHCRIAFVLGNHDCNREFTRWLGVLADEAPNFSWHPDYLILHGAAFLHGDCVHRAASQWGLDAYRKPWKTVRKKSETANAIYQAVYQAGITRTVPRLYFRRKAMANRVLAYLTRMEPELMEGVESIFVGHTHVPFTDFVHKGKRFHNTGTAIHRRQFNLLTFTMETGWQTAPEPVRKPS